MNTPERREAARRAIMMPDRSSFFPPVRPGRVFGWWAPTSCFRFVLTFSCWFQPASITTTGQICIFVLFPGGLSKLNTGCEPRVPGSFVEGKPSEAVSWGVSRNIRFLEDTTNSTHWFAGCCTHDCQLKASLNPRTRSL